MDNNVINLTDYARRREEATEPVRTTFAIWGGDGECARFALPLWRAAYLLSVSRAALAWEPVDEAVDQLVPAVVLDLGQEPARLDLPADLVASLRTTTEPPAMAMAESGGGVYLGERGGRRWYVVLTDPNGGQRIPEEEVREDLFFVAGECAGLLFHRGLDEPSEVETAPGVE